MFDVEEDSGSRIVGYLVPDSFTAVPRIRVLDGEVCLLELEANSARPSLVAAGRHGSGQCGFVVSEQEIPGLSTVRHLEIQEAESRFTIYRRFLEKVHVPLKLLRLETCHVRTTSLDQQLARHFQLAHTIVDRLGRETVTQTVMMTSCASHFVSARFPYREFEFSITDEFRRLCVLREPHAELAQTILALRQGAEAQESSFGLREQLSLEDCMAFFSEVDIHDQAALRAALVSMPSNVEVELANQLARLLAARTSDESARSTYLASALESLSTFDIVGIYEQPSTYLEPLQEMLGISLGGEPTLPADGAYRLAESLRSLPIIHDLLDMDIQVYETVRDALAASF